jgi:hypothetical protein
MLPTLLSGPTHHLRPARSADLRALRSWRALGRAWCPSPSLDWPLSDERLEGLLYPSDTQRALLVVPHGGSDPDGLLVISTLDWKNRAANLALVVPVSQPEPPQPPELEALEVLARFAYRELSLERLEAEVMERDERAADLLGGAGFTREGVKRQAAVVSGGLVDVSVWSRLRGDYRERP